MADQKDDLVAIPFKHVFLDIVGFTRNARPVKDQILMVEALNHAVREVVNERLNGYQHLLIPTGDGMCISMMQMKGARQLPFDLHLTVALEILRLLHLFPSPVPFTVRIGISDVANDSLITDIKGSLNVIGDGINLAQRIMNGADGNTILVSKRAHSELLRGGIDKNKFKQFWLVVKHNVLMEVYQYVDVAPGLLVAKPEGVLDPPVDEQEPSEVKVEPHVIQMHAKSFSDADDQPISIAINETSTIEYVITEGMATSHVFYFHVRTSLDEKGWIGFTKPPNPQYDTGAERTWPEKKGAGPRTFMNVRKLVKHRWPEFQGDVVEINRLRLRGGETEPSAVRATISIKE